jgi:hypothetical protein
LISRITAVTVAMLIAAGCSGERIVNTGEPPVRTATATPAPPPSPPANNAHLVNAFDYVAEVDGQTGYYFTTPSGKWRCAIIARVTAGCQSASSWRAGLGITGAPPTVPNAAGQATKPNAIVLNWQGDAHFAALDRPEFWLDPGPAKVVAFNRILAVAGFRCNVQVSGVSCVSDLTKNGFTFSADGYAPQYTDVPPNAP